MVAQRMAILAEGEAKMAALLVLDDDRERASGFAAVLPQLGENIRESFKARLDVRVIATSDTGGIAVPTDVRHEHEQHQEASGHRSRGRQRTKPSVIDSPEHQ